MRLYFGPPTPIWGRSRAYHALSSLDGIVPNYVAGDPEVHQRVQNPRGPEEVRGFLFGPLSETPLYFLCTPRRELS